MSEIFRDYGTRLGEFCELKNYKLIVDTLDYVILEDENGEKIYCSGHGLHLAMLEEGIK